SAGLMDKTQLPLPVRQICKRATDGIVDGLRTLAAPKHEDGVRWLVGLLGNRFELRPNWISGYHSTPAEVPRGARIGYRGKVDPPGEHPIGKSRQRILLHN